MVFSIKLFPIKGNLVFMNSFSHKIAVTAVGIALSFALEVNKEVKAATITLTPVTSFGVTDQNMDRLGDSYTGGTFFHVGLTSNSAGQVRQEDRAFYEFNIANLSPLSTVISNAIFRVRVYSISAIHRYYALLFFGYRGNGQPDISDFSRGSGVYPVSNFEPPIFLGDYHPAGYFEVNKFNFDLDFTVTPFVNKLITQNNAFAGFAVSTTLWPGLGNSTLTQNASLIITTVDTPEPVPEPTTIFGSALGLTVGGWLKRKKSSQQNKTTSQH
jgi:hypothetical protein